MFRTNLSTELSGLTGVLITLPLAVGWLAMIKDGR